MGNRLDPAIIMSTYKKYEDRVQIPGCPLTTMPEWSKGTAVVAGGWLRIYAKIFGFLE